MPGDVSPILLDQRIRNRLIEYLEIASSFEEQFTYQANVPIAHVPSEMIEMWADWVRTENLQDFREPVYSGPEQAAILDFYSVWEDVADDAFWHRSPLAEVVVSEPWARLRRAAEDALKVFQLRGKFNEEVEHPFT